MTKNLSKILMLGLAISLPSAFGSVLAPGGIGVPDPLTTTGSAIATASGTIPGGSFTATFNEWVFREASGNLDFVYQFFNSGPDYLENFSAGVYTGLITDVGIDTTGGVGVVGTNTPTSVSRNGLGSAVNWSGFAGSVAPNTYTVLLEVTTNATSYGPGTVSAQDTLTGFNNTTALGPVATPEPISMGLLGGGLALLGVARWRRSAKKA